MVESRRPPANWPSAGEVDIKNLTLKVGDLFGCCACLYAAAACFFFFLTSFMFFSYVLEAFKFLSLLCFVSFFGLLVTCEVTCYRYLGVPEVDKARELHSAPRGKIPPYLTFPTLPAPCLLPAFVLTPHNHQHTYFIICQMLGNRPLYTVTKTIGVCACYSRKVGNVVLFCERFESVTACFFGDTRVEMEE